MPLITWDGVCMLKSNGRIGLRKMDVINKEFQRKHAWKILTNVDSICVRIMRTKYLKNQDFLLYSIRQTYSPIWNSIMNCRQLLRKGMIWKASEGNEISFGMTTG